MTNAPWNGLPLEPEHDQLGWISFIGGDPEPFKWEAKHKWWLRIMAMGSPLISPLEMSQLLFTQYLGPCIQPGEQYRAGFLAGRRQAVDWLESERNRLADGNPHAWCALDAAMHKIEALPPPDSATVEQNSIVQPDPFAPFSALADELDREPNTPRSPHPDPAAERRCVMTAPDPKRVWKHVCRCLLWVMQHTCFHIWSTGLETNNHYRCAWFRKCQICGRKEGGWENAKS